MDKIKNAASRTKKFVSDHRVALACTATALPLIALHVRNTKVHNDFLREKGLYDEFYTMDETEPIAV